jgi:serine/threonine protein kinase
MMKKNPYVNHLEKEFEDEDHFYMVLDFYHNGTLESVIDDRKFLPVEVVRCYTA